MACQEICLRPDLPTGRSMLVYAGLIFGAGFLSYVIAKKQAETTVALLQQQM